ncbi:RHS repeat domain-containing protein [Flavobacterium branchiophilum]|uniref:RHS repeat domain-containing protein n=2 Tax=Flavobacterium branchiophilum TaxID=55197 RepID=UPI00030A9887|nr:RHS repeat-associated core domain-containing protein [Flavobacterium branchiophilum]
MNKVVNEAGVITTTDYINGFQYKTLPSGDGGLVFFPYAEGYVNVNKSYKLTESSLYNYVFNYTDHLGNIRMSYTQTPTGSLSILEENHYYPFGLKHTNYNSDKRLYVRESVASKIKPVTPLFPLVYNYKYNGKELQDELGLNMYDYGARNYDPAIGRWMNIDPLAEKYRRWTPYNYCVDNPMRFIDPDGMQVVDPTYTITYAIQNKDKRMVNHETYTKTNHKNGSFTIAKTTLSTQINSEGTIGKTTLTNSNITYTPEDKNYTDAMGNQVKYTDYSEKVNSSSSREATKEEKSNADGGFFESKVKVIAEKVNNSSDFIKDESRDQKSGQSEYKTGDINQTFTEVGIPISKVFPELQIDITVGQAQKLVTLALDFLTGKHSGEGSPLVLTPLQIRE